MPPCHPPSLTDVSRETSQKLQEYVALLSKWQKHINLVASGEADLWGRHIKDSLQLISALPAQKAEIYDLGSGAGLPGLVLAIATPRHHYYLVESDRRKSVFLKETARALGLNNVITLSQRIEALESSSKGDVIISRALAPLTKLIGLAAPLSKKNTFCLFLKGKNWDIEVAEARERWGFDLQAIPSQTNPDSRMLRLERIHRLNAG